VEEVQHSCSGLFDRSSCHVYDGPTVSRTKFSHIKDFLRDRLAVCIRRVAAFIERQQTMTPYLGNPFGARHESDDEGFPDIEQGWRRLDSRDKWNIRRFHAPVREVDARRCFRRPADAKQDYVSIVQICNHLSIVVRHCVVECVDALEVLGVQDMLPTDLWFGFGVQVSRQTRDDRIQDRDARSAHCLAATFDFLLEVMVGDREQDDSGLLLDFRNDAIKLFAGSDQGVDMLNGLVARIVGGCSPGYSVEGFAGGI